MRQSAEKLSNKMKQARDELEEDLKETRDVVKELKDFLSGKHCFSAEGRLISALIYGREAHLVSVIMTNYEWIHQKSLIGQFASVFSCFCLHRPVLQPDPHPRCERLDPESQAASQPGCSEEEAGGAEESGGQPTKQHGCAEQGCAAAGHSQETAAGSPGHQVSLHTHTLLLLILSIHLFLIKF